LKDYTIAIDAMGGDYGPEVTIPAALLALQQEEALSLIIVGDKATLLPYLEATPAALKQRLHIHHATQRVEMDESPTLALRNKKDSSMRVSINLVEQGQAKACVSAGNTGALMAIARFVLKTLPGINRPAISALLPTHQTGRMVRLLDLGANVDVRVEHFLQFAVMGSLLAEKVDHIPNPRITLLNIGAEAGKGNAQVKKANDILSTYTEALNYQGYTEGNTLFQGKTDVVICDGFAGNIALKTAEGTAQLITKAVKQAFKQNGWTQLIGLLAWPILRRVYKQLDPTYYNGASLVGLQGIVIKSHGSADIPAFTQAIHQAVIEVEQAVPQQISEQVSNLLQNTRTS
jgi:phosphate acyltransferase